MFSFFGELISFILKRKRFYLIPIVVASFILGGLIVFVEGSAVAPFIYALF